MANPELVLVADDEAEDRAFIAGLVREDGFEVFEASNGIQAGELLEAKDFDLVLTDLVMPGQSGFEVMRLAHKRNPEVICIAMTSFGSLESAVDALRHGAYSYLLKPCDPGTFRNTMKRGLEKQRLTKELRLRNQELETLNRELDSRVQKATAELRELNHRMLTEMASLQEVDRLKSSFLANVSHDLKSPMTTVMGYAQFFLEDDTVPMPPRWRESFQTMHRASSHMKYLVDQLVEAARLTSGKVTLKKEPVNVGELIEEAGSLMRSQAEAKGVTLESRWGVAKPLTILADRGRLLQVLSNLLGNALKFTPEKGSVTLWAREEEGGAHFCVEDTGLGIAPQHQARIFERFYQVDLSANRTFKGLGLGLCICKEIVELHGGRVWVESEPGKGSRFHVAVPAGVQP